MKIFSKIVLLVALLACAQFLHAAVSSHDLTSPNGKLKVVVNTDEVSTTYQLSLDGRPLIKESAISMTVASPTASSTPVVWGTGGIEPTVTFDEKNDIIKPLYGKSAELQDSYKEMTLNFGDYSIVVRVYNEGAAYRFVSHLTPSVKAYVKGELAEFTYAENVMLWYAAINRKQDLMANGDNWERFYTKIDGVANINVSRYDNNQCQNDYKWCLPPLTAGFNGGDGVKVVVHESDLHSYPLMYLEKNGSEGMKGVWEYYPTEEDKSDTYCPKVKSRGDYIAVNTGTHKYPWRVMMVAENDKDLLTNQLVYKLASPQSTNYNFNEFVAPGKSTWDYWHNAYVGITDDGFAKTPTNGFNIYKRYADYAAANGLQYITIDTDGEHSMSDAMLKDIADYAHSKGLKVVKWGYVGEFFWHRDGWGETKLVLNKYKELGVDVYKCDFFYRSDQLHMEAIEQLAQTTAALGMGLLLHGNPMPNGLDRTYPHILGYEAVPGGENYKWDGKDKERLPTAKRHLEVPFIRMLAGGMDYTPGSVRNVFYSSYSSNNNNPVSIGTRTHEMAMQVVYDQYIATFCDKPDNYDAAPDARDFLAKIPVSWDETVALDGKIGEYAVVARRTGKDWYIGGMVNTAKNFDVNTLKPILDRVSGNYQVYLYTDGSSSDAKNMQKRRMSVAELEAMPNISCVGEGGFIVHIVKKETPVFSSGKQPFEGVGYPREVGGNIWTDCDGDGDQDVLIWGGTWSSETMPRLYKNDGNGNFIDATAAVFGSTFTSHMPYSGATWLDYNGDGVKDLLLVGEVNSAKGSYLYKGQGAGNSYTLTRDNVAEATLTQDGVDNGAGESPGRFVVAEDYNGDGYEDVLISGRMTKDGGNTWNHQFLLYKSNGATFTLMNSLVDNVDGGNFIQCHRGGIAWGDFNNDGRPDILFAGRGDGGWGTEFKAGIYMQKADNTFTLITLQGVDGRTIGTEFGEVAWIDYDKDGDLDALITGKYWLNDNWYDHNAILMRNNGDNTFTEVLNNGVLGTNNTSSIAVGDLNMDGYDDLVIIGDHSGSNKIFYNNQGNGTFTADNGLGLPQIKKGMVSMADADTDGYLDICVVGNDIQPTIFINEYQATDSRFASLGVAGQALTPAFGTEQTEYRLHVPNNVETITITAAAEHRKATVSGDVGTKSLSVGENSFAVTVTAEDGITATTCTITVTRAEVSDATLKEITLSAGTLSPAFNPRQQSYSVNVGNSVTSITIGAKANHAQAIVADGVGTKSLNEGSNDFNIKVISQLGDSTLTYKLRVNRATVDAGSDATLRSLSVSQGALDTPFDAATYSYSVAVECSVASIAITAEANDGEHALLSGDGEHVLAPGLNTFELKVTAENGSLLTYTVRVVRYIGVSTITDTVCDSIRINGIKYVESGTYYQTLTNAAGCDSVITITLTINDCRPDFTVTFNSQGGSAVASQQVKQGDKVTEPDAPSREGYTFEGWYTEAAGTNLWNFVVARVTDNMTLYAKWTVLPSVYTVTFDSQGGSAVAAQQVVSGGKVTLPTPPTRTGYTFVGWYRDATGLIAWNFNGGIVLNNMTLYAKWKVVTHTVSFVSLGGSSVPVQQADHGSKLTKPDNPTRTGYDFVGWYKEKDCINAWDFDTDIVTTSHTLFAKWTSVTTAIGDNDMQSVKLYPNPVVNGQLTVENEQYSLLTTHYSIEIYSLSGALIATHTATGAKTSLNVSQLPSGTYILKMGSYTGKFVKQ